MSTQPKAFLTPDEYLAIDRKADRKSEYWNGEMFAMAGASIKHGIIQANILVALGNALLDCGCQPLGSDTRVRTPSGLFTYPDALVTCGEMKVADEKGDLLLNPALIVEILSPSTERYDRGMKFEQYRTIESLRAYLLLASDRMHAELYNKPEAGQWSFADWSRPDDMVPLECCGCSLKLADIYRNVEFTAPTSLRES